MSKKEENIPFTCQACKKYVTPLKNGSYRNHCPHCLCSIHVDNKPGDRQNPCKGLMKPSKLTHTGNKGWQIVHKCTKCGHHKSNKIAENDPLSDDWDQLIKITD